jgi:hypothetical protein
VGGTICHIVRILGKGFVLEDIKLIRTMEFVLQSMLNFYYESYAIAPKPRPIY